MERGESRWTLVPAFGTKARRQQAAFRDRSATVTPSGRGSTIAKGRRNPDLLAIEKGPTDDGCPGRNGFTSPERAVRPGTEGTLPVLCRAGGLLIAQVWGHVPNERPQLHRRSFTLAGADRRPTMGLRGLSRRSWGHYGASGATGGASGGASGRGFGDGGLWTAATLPRVRGMQTTGREPFVPDGPGKTSPGRDARALQDLNHAPGRHTAPMSTYLPRPSARHMKDFDLNARGPSADSACQLPRVPATRCGNSSRNRRLTHASLGASQVV